MLQEEKIPIHFKWIFCVFMAFFISIYWVNFGPLNFLWFSDVTLILAFLATMFSSSFLASMAATGGFVFSIFWNIDFIFSLLGYFFGSKFMGFNDYLFTPNLPAWLRVLTLYHVPLPFLFFWLVYRLGYHQKAWIVQVVLSWIVILTTWYVTEYPVNINLVHSYEFVEWITVGAIPYLIIGSIVVSMIVAGTHLFFKSLQKNKLVP